MKAEVHDGLSARDTRFPHWGEKSMNEKNEISLFNWSVESKIEALSAIRDGRPDFLQADLLCALVNEDLVILYPQITPKGRALLGKETT